MQHAHVFAAVCTAAWQVVRMRSADRQRRSSIAERIFNDIWRHGRVLADVGFLSQRGCALAAIGGAGAAPTWRHTALCKEASGDRMGSGAVRVVEARVGDEMPFR